MSPHLHLTFGLEKLRLHLGQTEKDCPKALSSFLAADLTLPPMIPLTMA